MAGRADAALKFFFCMEGKNILVLCLPVQPISSVIQQEYKDFSVKVLSIEERTKFNHYWFNFYSFLHTNIYY